MANTINAEIREMKNPREMRRAGQIPAVVYGKDFHKEISLPKRDFEKLLASATRSSMIDIAVDGASVNAFIKEIQYHPLNDSIMHVDFFRPADDQIIKMEIPVKFVGEPMGRRRGGAINKVRDAIVIKAPGNVIPAIFEADISELDVGGKVRAGDIELPEGAELFTPPEVLLLQVIIPRRAKAELEEAEAGTPEGEGEEGESASAAEAAAPDAE